MCYDAPGKGLVLVSGFRDPGRQWDIRHDRVPHGQECNPRVKAHPATATPARLVNGKLVGGSNHQRRTAADAGGRALRWAGLHCHAYGLYLAVSTENWHFEATAYAPTVRILRYPGKTFEGGTVLVNPPPKPLPPKVEEALMVTNDDIKKLRDIFDQQWAKNESALILKIAATMDQRINPDGRGNLLWRLRDNAAKQNPRIEEITNTVRELIKRTPK